MNAPGYSDSLVMYWTGFIDSWWWIHPGSWLLGVRFLKSNFGWFSDVFIICKWLQVSKSLSCDEYTEKSRLPCSEYPGSLDYPLINPPRNFDSWGTGHQQALSETSFGRHPDVFIICEMTPKSLTGNEYTRKLPGDEFTGKSLYLLLKNHRRVFNPPWRYIMESITTANNSANIRKHPSRDATGSVRVEKIELHNLVTVSD